MSAEQATRPAGRLRLRFVVAYVLPTMALLGLAIWPLVTGARTLFFRDVFNTHLQMKWFQAEAMRSGELPLIDPSRAGGQPHLGNPNTVALYPDNLIYLVASTLWAFNAHFWLHLLLAPFTFFWLGRELGLGREASWAGGVVFAASGYLLSCLNLYNLIAPVVWAPALSAACLQVAAAAHPLRLAWRPAAVWALVLLGGDPITAVLALALALGLVVAVKVPPRSRWGVLAAAVALGTLLAAPLVLEFARILTLSFRGHWGYSLEAATAGSWNPMRALDWILPLAFGRPDLLFWGHKFHGGFPPLFYSLAPGLLALALVAVGLGGRSRLRWWALAAVAVGLFVSLGKMNPLIGWVLTLPGGDLLRMPIKAWLFVMIGIALLAALGFERIQNGDGLRALRRALACIGAVCALGWLSLHFSSEAVQAFIQASMPKVLADAGLAPTEHLRWTGLALLATLLSIFALILSALLRRRLGLLGAMLLALHVASQLFLLRPLFEMDDPAIYLTPSPVETVVPAGARVVHGVAENLFEEVSIPFHLYPDGSSRWLHRQLFREFYPNAGEIAGRRFDFDFSPEGLDSFLTRAAAQVLRKLPDSARIRILAASGVEWLVLKRDLDQAVVEAGDAELVAQIEALAGDLRIYRLPRRAAEAEFAGTIFSSETLNDAVDRMIRSDFDPRSQVVIAGRLDPGSGLEGTVRTLSAERERLAWEVDAKGSGALLIQRSHLPLYRARVDGESVPFYAANVHRIAVLLEAGTHTVELWVDRTRFRLGIVLALMAVATLAALARSGASAS